MSTALSFGVGGCSNHPEYIFKGKIDGEFVEYYDDANNNNDLFVIDKNRNEILYTDKNNDLSIDTIQITTGGNTTYYHSDSTNEDVKKVIKKGQEKFDFYLSRIMDVQTAPLMDPVSRKPNITNDDSKKVK